MSHFLEVKETRNISKIKINKYTSNSLQDSSNISNSYTVWTDLFGSSFKINPDSNTDYIYYEYNFSMCEDSSVTGGDMVIIKLEYSTDSGLNWSDFSDSYVPFGSYDSGLVRKNIFNYRQLISNWGNTERLIKASSNMYSSNGAQLHKLNNFYDTTGLASSNYHYRPFAICYEITN